jgi:hypothetical protein
VFDLDDVGAWKRIVGGDHDPTVASGITVRINSTQYVLLS